MGFLIRVRIGSVLDCFILGVRSGLFELDIIWVCDISALKFFWVMIMSSQVSSGKISNSFESFGSW